MSTGLASSRHTLEPLRSNHRLTQAYTQQATVDAAEFVADQVPARNSEIWLLLALIAFIFFLLKFLRALKAEPQIGKPEPPLTLFQKTPCLSCHYFASNSYLKCAVRPTDVLTTRAIHCSDYCPRYKRV